MKDGATTWSKAPTSLSAHLAESVLALIKDERLEAGDRLPSVKELAERFSVATPTMREALRLLEMAGNLDIRHGFGIYVRSSESPADADQSVPPAPVHGGDPQPSSRAGS